MAEYKAEQERKEEERKAEFERQQKEYEAEQARRDKQRKARVATFERIIEQAPASFNPAQLRVFLRLLIHLDYSFLEEVANHFADGDENSQQSDEEIVLAALDGTADERLTGLALTPSSSLTKSASLTKTSRTCSLRPSRCSHRRSSRRSKPRAMVPASRSRHLQKLRQRKRRQERKQPRCLHSGPGFVRGRFVFRHAAKSRRETPLRFLPEPSSRFATGPRSPAARQKTFPLLHCPLGSIAESKRRNLSSPCESQPPKTHNPARIECGALLTFVSGYRMT